MDRYQHTRHVLTEISKDSNTVSMFHREHLSSVPCQSDMARRAVISTNVDTRRRWCSRRVGATWRLGVDLGESYDQRGRDKPSTAHIVEIK